jgi:signal transduction histidine kinase
LLLRRAIDNLLANAVRYGRGSTIEVSVGREESIVAIEVSDRGPGIPEADRERVMQPLERLDRDEDSSGTGLGLSIVADIARAHGGTARILEREEGGTTVRVELPAGS